MSIILVCFLRGRLFQSPPGQWSVKSLPIHIKVVDQYSPDNVDSVYPPLSPLPPLINTSDSPAWGRGRVGGEIAFTLINTCDSLVLGGRMGWGEIAFTVIN